MIINGGVEKWSEMYIYVYKIIRFNKYLIKRVKLSKK